MSLIRVHNSESDSNSTIAKLRLVHIDMGHHRFFLTDTYTRQTRAETRRQMQKSLTLNKNNCSNFVRKCYVHVGYCLLSIRG